MVVKYTDSDGNIITEANREIVLMYARRLIVNGYPSGCKEGDHVLVFTEENVEKIFNYFNDKLLETMKELLETKKEYLELTNRLHNRFKELEEDNQKLRRLNNQLSLKLVELKEST
ncbi:hypothetical protein DSECCO2_622750 [anaerobic digester metagenome]